MSKKLHCIMLIDDNKHDNHYHNWVIRTHDRAEHVICQERAEVALQYLRNHEQPHPDMIFLDINMPGMDGWEFLEEYNKLDADMRSELIVVMLSTSENKDEKARAEGLSVLSDFKSKPLTVEILDEIMDQYF